MANAAVRPIVSFRILAGALMVAPVIIAVALAFVVGHSSTDRYGNPVQTHAPGVGLYVAILVLGVVATALVQLVGYRIAPLRATLGQAEARSTAVRVYQQSMILRFALSESVMIVAIALLFADRSDTIVPYLVGAVISELLMAYHVWPSESLISRVQQRLDRDGARSDLGSTLTGTAIDGGVG